ncbi:MAG TPA: LLM class flavin-dependent oxidoreductase [Candidatus Angelobacter sp.]|jgi:alkanesulfonate monooxygenase
MLQTFKETSGIEVYTSSPSETVPSPESYVARLRQGAQWSDWYGCRGMLIYTDNRSIDPWVLAQDVIAHTETLSPLIAVQPVYMHPYAAAQKLAALARVYKRSIDLNFVAGGFQYDLAALDDNLGHDARYERLSEYGSILTKLLKGERVTVRGQYYNVLGLKLDWNVSKDLYPMLTVSGSSPAGLKCAQALGAVAVMYPKPLEPNHISNSSPVFPEAQAPGLRTGIRIGILARESAEDAWAEANVRFPESPSGKAMRKSAVQATDSSWLRQLSTLADQEKTTARDVYWLGPFGSLKSFCPYLVGSYGEVASYLAAYLRDGVRLIILDAPREEQDLGHACHVIQQAVSAVMDSSTNQKALAALRQV